MAGKSEQTEQALTDSVTQAEQALTALGGVVEGEVSLGGLPEEYLLVDLGEVAFVNSGVGFPKKYQGNTDGEYPVYKVGDVSKAFLNAEGKLAKAGHYVSSDIAAEMKGKVFPVGATAFAKIGEAVRLNRRALIQRAGLADNNVMIVKADLSSMDLYVYQFLRTQSLDDVPEQEEEVEDACPEHQVVAGQRADALHQAVQCLPVNQKLVVELKFFQHCTFDDIANQLGISVNTAKSRLYSALDKLKGKLEFDYV